MVGGPIAAERRDHAEPDPDHRREENRVERQLRRRRDELAEVVRDGLVSQRRLPEVAVHEMVEIDRIADRKRLVEAVVLLERGHGRRIARRLLAEVRRDGIARHELGEHERDERDPERQEHERREPAQHETGEAAGREHPPASLQLSVRALDGSGRHSSRAQNGRPKRTSKRT